MKRKLVLAILCFAFVVTMAAPLAAQEEADESILPRSGLFVGGGGALAFETKQLKRVSGGPDLRVGWRFETDLSLYLTMDAYFTSKFGTTIIDIPVMGNVSYNIIAGLYSFGGFGYDYMRSSIVTTFSANNLVLSKNNSGFTAISGMGYDFWVKKITISPELGFRYTRIANANWYMPFGRVAACYHF